MKKSPIRYFPLQNETTSDVYVGYFGLHNSRLVNNNKLKVTSSRNRLTRERRPIGPSHV